MFIGCGSYCIIRRTQVMQYDCREMDTYFCPPIVLWDPCFNYVRKFKRPVMCPDHFKILEPTGQWMNSSSNSRTPRAVWSAEGLHLLVAREYICPGTVFEESHRIRTTDSRLIDIIGKDTCDILFSRKCSFFKMVLSAMMDDVSRGASFCHIEQKMRQRQLDFVSLCEQELCDDLAMGIMHLNLEIDINGRVKELQQLLTGCVPDSETIRRTFVCWCNIYRKEMESCMQRTEATALMADHTFKVSVNIGVHQEADSKWLRLFNSLFIVMNENKEVLTWQLTKREKFNVVSDMLMNLKNRMDKSPTRLQYFVIDNCCKWENKIKELFGQNVKVKLDLFHALQRLTRTLEKSNPYQNRICQDLRSIFRQEGDSRQFRTMATPTAEVIEQKLLTILNSWESVQALLDGKSIINTKFKKAVENLLIHIRKGCLSDIPVGLATGMNENLHKNLNKVFKGLKMGPELAVSLLTMFFYIWNGRRICQEGKRCYKSIFALKSSSFNETHNEKEKFGIGISSEKITFDLPLTEYGDDSSVKTINFTLMKRKIFVFKKLNSMSWLEKIPQELFFAEIIVFKLLQMRQPFVCQSELQHGEALKSRCKNFGYFPIASLPISIDDENKLLTVSTLTIGNFMKENEYFSGVTSHLKSIGFTSDANKDFSMLKIIVQEDLKMQYRNLHDLNTNSLKRQRLGNISSNKISCMKPEFTDIIIQTISNLVQLPIVVFTSIPNIPILPIIPENRMITTDCLFMAINFSGKVSFELLSKDLLVLQNKDKKDVSSRKGCMCGKNDKNRLPKCTMVEGSKYSCKCPCFKFQQSCANCNCKGCMNPFGISKGNGPKRKIESSKAKAALTHLRPCAKKGSQFLKDEGEPSTSTRWNIDETILLLSLMEEFGGAGDNVNICKLFCKIARANTDSSLLIEEKSQRQVEGKLRNLKELQQIWYSQVYIAMEQPAASVASMDVHTSTENNI
eukprot:gene9384-10373_t